MATHIVFCLETQPKTQRGWPVPRPDYATAESIAPGGVATPTTGSAPSVSGGKYDCRLVRVAAVGEHARVAVGPAGTTASASNSVVIPNGMVEYLPCEPGDKVSVIQV